MTDAMRVLRRWRLVIGGRVDRIGRGRGEDATRTMTVVFWLSVLLVPLSSVITIVALSRHLPPGELAAVSTIFGLSFVAAVLPMAAQSQAAADLASTGEVGPVHWPPIQMAVMVLAVASPIVARLIGLPWIAVLLPIVQVLPAVAVGATRGELIARRSYRPAALNHAVDATVRVVSGVGLGLAFGAAGVGASLLLAAAVSWVALPMLEENAERRLHLPAALIASALLTLSVQLDVLLAPRLLGAQADTYAVAALPAKGVFLALMAAGWLVIPAAAGFTRASAALKPIALTVVAGTVLTAGAVVAGPVLGALLGRGNPDRGLVLVMGLAMAAASGNWVCLQIRLTRGASALWTPALAAIAVTVAVSEATATATGLAAAMLLGQMLALAVGVIELCRETVTATTVPASTPAASVPPASVPPASVPPASVPPASVPPASVPRYHRSSPTHAHGSVLTRPTTGTAPEPPSRTALPHRPLFSSTRLGRAHHRRPRWQPRPPVDPHTINGVAQDDARCPRHALGWTSVLLLVAAVLQNPGAIVPETKLDVSVDSMTFLSRIWHLWEPAADMGHVQNQAVGYLFPMGPFFLVGQWLHVPDWLLQRGWMGLVLVVAFWGTARLADELRFGTPASRVLGALAYAVSPFFIARVGSTSAFVLGGALLPWIMLPLVRASRVGSTRRGAALSGLAVFAIGGINGAVTLAVLVTPLVWLLTRERGRRRNQLLAWWLVAVGLATAWWVIPLAFQLRYGFNFLPYTERASTTTAYTSVPETVRGTADWLSYLHLREGWLPAGWRLAAEPLAMTGTFLAAALGLFGLARRDLPHRLFLVTSFLCGVALVGAGYGGLLGDPAAQAVRAALDGPAGLFRNVYKFQPVVALPLAFGTMHGIDLAARWARSGSREWRRIRVQLRTAIPLAVLGVVALAALPLVTGGLVSGRGFQDVPSWWTDFEQFQVSTIQPGRALLVPGTPTADYTWGRTLDEPLQAGTDSPWALRSLIPLGGPGSTRLLDAVEQAIERGGDSALIPYLQHAGITYVVARNDVNWREWNAPRPIQVHRALLASGLTTTRSFGPNLPLDGDTSDPGFAVDGAEHALHAIEVYRVAAPSIVESYPTRTAAVLSGGPEAGLALARAGLDDRAMILVGDLPADQPVPSTWVVTDTLRRRYVEYGLMRSNASYTLPAGSDAPDGNPLGPQLLPTDGEQHQTVAHLDGVAGITASSYGSWLYQIPEAAPANALDDDPTTAWVAGPTHTSAGEWWQTDLASRLDLSGIDVQLLEDGAWRPQVRSLRVTTEAGSLVQPVRADETVQHLQTPAGPTSWLRITFESVEGESETSAGAGLRSVQIPGVQVHHELIAPSEMTAAFSGPAAAAPVYLFERATADPRSLLRRDEETTLARQFTVPGAHTFQLHATATALPGDPLFALLHDAGSPAAARAGLRVQASSTLQDLPEYDPTQLVDGRDDTAWAAQPPDATRLPPPLAPGRDGPTSIDTSTRTEAAGPSPQTADARPHVTLSWDGPRTLDSVVITPAPGFTRPRSILITSADGERRASLGPDDHASFAPLTATSVEVSFPDVATERTRNPIDGSLTALPVGLAGLRFPALADLTPPSTDASQPVHISCADGPTATIDGVTHHFEVDTTVGGLTSLAKLPVHDCGGDVQLAAGVHHLDTARGRAPLSITSVIVQDSDLPPPPNGGAAPLRGITDKPRATSRAVRPLAWGKEAREIEVDSGPESYVVVDENFSSGWQARLNGTVLRAVRLDGWRQAFVVPAGAGGVIDLTFTPAASYRVALVVGFLLVGLLLLLALVPTRRLARPSGVGEATPPWWLAAMVGTALGVAIGGPAAAVLIPLAVLVPRAVRSRAPAVAAGAFLLSGVWVVAGTGHGPAEHTGAFGLPAQLLALVAVLAVTAQLVTVPPSLTTTLADWCRDLFAVPDEPTIIDLRVLDDDLDPVEHGSPGIPDAPGTPTSATPAPTVALPQRARVPATPDDDDDDREPASLRFVDQ